MKSFTLEERAAMSASHKQKIGTPEWHAAYNDFIAKSISGVSRHRTLSHNAAIFASRMAPGMQGTDVWDKLFRNYIERSILKEEVKAKKKDLQHVPLPSSPEDINGTN